MFPNALLQSRCGSARGQAIDVRVTDAYRPSIIRAEAGRPIRLVFHREVAVVGSDQLVFPAFGKSVTLPYRQPVAVELVPTQSGEYVFTCGIGLLGGRLIVSPAEGMRRRAHLPSARWRQERRARQPRAMSRAGRDVEQPDGVDHKHHEDDHRIEPDPDDLGDQGSDRRTRGGADSHAASLLGPGRAADPAGD